MSDGLPMSFFDNPEVHTPSPSLNPNKTLTNFFVKSSVHTGYPFLYFYFFVLLVHIRGNQTCCFRYIVHVSLRKWGFINQEELFLLSISKEKNLVIFFKKKYMYTTRVVVQ
jgi:hypothetical protein